MVVEIDEGKVIIDGIETKTDGSLHLNPSKVVCYQPYDMDECCNFRNIKIITENHVIIIEGYEKDSGSNTVKMLDSYLEAPLDVTYKNSDDNSVDGVLCVSVQP